MPRPLAPGQIVKRRAASRGVQVDIRSAPGSQRRVHPILDRLGDTPPNTAALERRNGTARRMSAHPGRQSLAFSRRPETHLALGWWSLTVYNGCRPHRSLRLALAQPQAKKFDPQTPALALGLTGPVGSLRDLLLTPVSR